MQQLRHPAPAACRTGQQGAGGGVAVRDCASGSEPAPQPAVPQNTALYWSFPGSALDVSLSRRWLAAAVEQAWGAGEDADRVVLAYSEVATNAVVHGAGPVTVSARIRAGTVTCEVADCSVHPPRPRHAGGEDVCGRGLDLVELTVDRFGVDIGEAGKTVSFEVGRQDTDTSRSGRSPVPWSGPGPVGPRSASQPGPGTAPGPGLASGTESASRTESAPGPGSASGTGPAHSSAGGPAGGPAGGEDGGKA
ncbi:anti-sigma regulatory factor (Ser/Thr protein kinase) [Catenulispora sp. GP43]|uniref:ATP-binding protein n=1 Tax=Catenulispora sp. GP43 TaxID=3156263 RepID=UPI00351704B6